MNLYYFICNIKNGSEKGLRSLHNAAEQGNGVAQYCLGYIYETNQEDTKKYQETEKWYSKATEQDSLKWINTESLFRLGLIYHKEKYYTKAYKCWIKAAELGHLESLQKLLYVNDPIVIKWRNNCTFETHPIIPFCLGQIHRSIYHDDTFNLKEAAHEALKYFEQAANQNHDAVIAGKALFEIGDIYYCGAGVEEDESKAAECWIKAYEKGYKSVIEDDLMELAIVDGNEVAKEWFWKMADQGVREAQYVRAQFDPISKVTWLTKAAEQKYCKAIMELAQYRLGRNGRQESEKLLRLAAEQGDYIAQMKLARNLYHAYRTNGKETDFIELLKWLGRAAEQEFPYQLHQALDEL